LENPLHQLIVNRRFEQFQPGLQARFKAHRVSYSYQYCEPIDNPALVLDFETPELIGRLTAWVSGFCDTEVLEISSQKTVFYKHYELHTENEFHEKLAELFLFLKDEHSEQNDSAKPPHAPPRESAS
jgi:hypothetical protein